MKKRILSLLLAVVMIVGMLPTFALAAEAETGNTTTSSDVEYGSYDESGKWNKDEDSNGTYTDPTTGIKVSKIAVPVDGKPNEYTVTLTVEMKQTASTVAAPAATVLVIDCSGSMEYCAECGGKTNHKKECKYHKNQGSNNITTEQSRLYAAKNAAYSFLDTYKGTKSGIGRWVAVVGFGSGLKNIPSWYDVSTTDGYNAVRQAIGNLSADGGTNLDAGLEKAAELLNDNRFDAKTVKNAIALTDGKPTYYHSNGYDISNTGSDCGSDTFRETKESATALKSSAKLYTVCFGASRDEITDYSRPEYNGPVGIVASYPHKISVGDYLKNHISSGTGYAFNADNTTELNNAFKDITQTIMDGIVAGTVTDSLPTAVSTTDPSFAGSWELKPADAKVVTNDDGSKTYIYEMTYTVKIDPTKVDEGTVYQPLNGKTYLSYGKEGRIDFPIPAGKVTYPETEYKLIYNANGGNENSLPTPNPETAKTTADSHNFTVSSTEPTREGYTFTGWNTAEDGTGTSYAKNSIVTATKQYPTVNLYAQWTKNTYTVTGTIDNGGTVTNASQTGIEHGSAAQNMVFTPATGYKISKIEVKVGEAAATEVAVTDEKSYTYSNSSVTDNITVTVTTVADESQTKSLSYTVEYYLDGTIDSGKTQTVSQTVQVLAPDTLTINWNDINRTNAFGEGASFSSVDPAATTTTIADKDVIKVYYVSNTYTVTYTDGVDGEEVFKDQVTNNVKYGGTIPGFNGTPTRDGYTFTGWKWYKGTVAEGNELLSKPDTMPADNLIAVAQWTANASFNLNTDITINKSLNANGAALTEAQRTFKVNVVEGRKDDTTGEWTYDGTAIVGEVKYDATVTKFTFDATAAVLSFTAEGMRKYEITEVNSGVAGMTYDSNVYYLTITVTKDDDNNKYVATGVITDGGGKTCENNTVTFVNTFTPLELPLDPVPGEGDTGMPGKFHKVLYSDTELGQSFQITLAGMEGTNTAGVSRTATAEVTTPNKGSSYTYEADFVFGGTNGTLVFTAPGTYTYTITEYKPNIINPGMKYDVDTDGTEQTSHTMVVTVEANKTTNALEITSVTVDGKESNLKSAVRFLVIYNEYTQPSSSAVKAVITNEDDIPAGITMPAGVRYPTNGTVTVDKNVNSVTLAYTVTVTGENGKTVGVHDDATYVGYHVSDTEAANVDVNWVADGMVLRFYGNATVTLYYTKTFYRDETTGKFATATNTAKINGEPTNTTETEIKDKTPGGFDFSDIILKDLYVTGDQNFPESLTFRAKLKLENFIPEGKPEIQALSADNVVDAWTFKDTTLTATFYPEDVKFGKHNVKNFLSNGSHLYLTFPAEGRYIFTVQELNDGVDGVKYDGNVYMIEVYVTAAIDGESLEVSGCQIYLKIKENEWKLLENETIVFCNEADTGDIPYYPIIPVLPTVKDEGKLNKTDHFAYIIGYPDGTVHPSGEITRAEVATIFFRLLKDDVRNAYFTSYNNYSDVQLGKWYNNPISTMSALGIIKGYPDGTFRPNAPITRAEFAAIAARFDETARRGTTTFTDVYGHWAADEIAKAYDNNWIKGYPDGTFRPDRNITRAEAMTLINRVLDRAPESPSDLLPDMNKWSDNMDTTKWYYLAVQEATNSHDYTRKTFNYEMWKRMLLDPDWSRYER